jgi:hypothetical protein
MYLCGDDLLLQTTYSLRCSPVDLKIEHHHLPVGTYSGSNRKSHPGNVTTLVRTSVLLQQAHVVIRLA